jgi:hypothetical protein
MNTIDTFTEIDEILSFYRDQINLDYVGYKNHCIRILNFLNYLRPLNTEEREKLIIATAFHDIGLWTKNTLDYLAPSIKEVEKYLENISKSEWILEISTIIHMHHKITPYRGSFKFVELFSERQIWWIFLSE